MTAEQLEKSGILYNRLIYIPKVVPVDYGNFMVYQFTLHFIDGTAIQHSSCEVEGNDEDTCIDATLDLMQKDAQAYGVRPRCDYLDAAKTLAYCKLTGRENHIQFLVSACLAGECCRYDGSSNRIDNVARLVDDGFAIPVCPEVSGGLETPRPSCEFVQNKVIGADGIDCTDAFKTGAQDMLALAQQFKVNQAVCKQRSPSCGCGKIYDGTFSGHLIEGDGLAVALLKANGIHVTTEEDWQ